jgi:hypothetical protein
MLLLRAKVMSISTPSFSYFSQNTDWKKIRKGSKRATLDEEEGEDGEEEDIEYLCCVCCFSFISLMEHCNEDDDDDEKDEEVHALDSRLKNQEFMNYLHGKPPGDPNKNV